MSPSNAHSRLEWIHVPPSESSHRIAEIVSSGLSRPQKSLPCHLFYDKRGSQLFEDICALPEYYLTRSEREILEAHAEEIAAQFGGRPMLAELGSGSSAKTQVLIEAFLRRHGRLRYAPIDISPTILEESALVLLDRYDTLEIIAIAAEYRRGLEKIDRQANRNKLILWLGSSVGNFSRKDAGQFLRGVHGHMSADDRLLVGVDLRKSAAILEPAYDDQAGVTAEFNKNILRRLNRELQANFDVNAFAHRAVYVETEGRVEMHLVSERAQCATIGTSGETFQFEAGETIHTENSYKYSFEEMNELARLSGFHPKKRWTDSADLFGLNLWAPQ